MTARRMSDAERVVLAHARGELHRMSVCLWCRQLGKVYRDGRRAGQQAARAADHGLAMPSPKVARALTNPPKACPTCGRTSCGCSDSAQQVRNVEAKRTPEDERPILVAPATKRRKR